LLTGAETDPLSLTYGAPIEILAVTPYSYTPFPGETFSDSALSPAWRNSTWHIVVGQGFANDADTATIQKAFTTANEAGNILRSLAPDSGAYQNEADVFEPDASDSFWGQANYQRLLRIKKSLDPSNVLTCWGCIGFQQTDPRYSCYPQV
jgi:hypothetical protein